MKGKLTIFLYVALLPSIIYGARSIKTYVNNVRRIAEEEGRIEGIFQPEGDRPLGKGRHAFVYAGILFPSEKKIAMKFTLLEDISDAKKEYEMYSYLDAINNPAVERYGIPSVYYIGKWNENDLIMMGITLLDQNILQLKLSNRFSENDVNALIVLRDFIIASKYMHSRGVRHDDIKTKNIMVRGHRGFLIDFNLSSKMNQKSKNGSEVYVSRRAHTNGERYPKDDWESFLYSVCYSFGAQFEWFGLSQSPTATYNMKSNIAAIKNEIKKKITSKRLKNIMIGLAKHVFDDGGEGAEEAPFYDASNSKRFPDYSRFYNMVNEEIEKLNVPTPAMFTWLSPEQERAAIDDFNEHGILNITEISDPKNFDFSSMESSEADFRKFFAEIAIDINVDEDILPWERIQDLSTCRII